MLLFVQHLHVCPEAGVRDSQQQEQSCRGGCLQSWQARLFAQCQKTTCLCGYARDTRHLSTDAHVYTRHQPVSTKLAPPLSKHQPAFTRLHTRKQLCPSLLVRRTGLESLSTIMLTYALVPQNTARIR